MEAKNLRDIDPAAFMDFLVADRKARAKKHGVLAQQEAIANADAHTNNAGLPTYSELIAALRIGKHHANKAADLAHSLASVNDRNGMHGSAAALTKAAGESDQAAALMAAVLARVPS